MEGPIRYDHYKVLGIPRDASVRRIKQAYRQRVKAYHPDRNPAPNAALVFQAIHEAYKTLGDDRLRVRYDDRLRFYRRATDEPTTPVAERYERPAPSMAHRVRECPPRPFQRFAFIGLHITGLLFGISTIASILFCITFQGWPVILLVFSAPGIFAIPASLEGLMRSGDEGRG